MSLLALAAGVLDSIQHHGRRGCLIGGLAVSSRCDPRFTRDVDLAVAVSGDNEGEALIRALATDGFVVHAVVEQEAVGRMAMVRVANSDGVSVDLLMASSGIESEIVARAETIEVVQGVRIPVARVGHLIALKLLSVAPGRETDAMDLRSLAAVASDDDWDLAHEAVELIHSRGFSRDRNLVDDLAVLRGQSKHR